MRMRTFRWIGGLSLLASVLSGCDVAGPTPGSTAAPAALPTVVLTSEPNATQGAAYPPPTPGANYPAPGASTAYPAPTAAP